MANIIAYPSFYPSAPCYTDCSTPEHAKTFAYDPSIRPSIGDFSRGIAKYKIGIILITGIVCILLLVSLFR